MTWLRVRLTARQSTTGRGVQLSRAAERAEAGLAARRTAKRPRRDAPFDVQRARATAFALGFGADEVTAEEAELLPQGFSTAKYALVCSRAAVGWPLLHGSVAGSSRAGFMLRSVTLYDIPASCAPACQHNHAAHPRGSIVILACLLKVNGL